MTSLAKLVLNYRSFGEYDTDKNDLHFTDFAVQLSQKQKAAHVRSRHVLLQPLDALVEEAREKVLVSDLYDGFDIVLGDDHFVGVDVSRKARLIGQPTSLNCSINARNPSGEASVDFHHSLAVKVAIKHGFKRVGRY